MFDHYNTEEIGGRERGGGLRAETEIIVSHSSVAAKVALDVCVIHSS